MQNAEADKVNAEADKVTLRIILSLNFVFWFLFCAILIGRWHTLQSHTRFWAVFVPLVFPQAWWRLIHERVSVAALMLLTITSLGVLGLFAEGM